MRKVFTPLAAAEFCTPVIYFFPYKMSGSISRDVGTTCEFKVGKKERQMTIKSERLADFPLLPCA